MKPEFGVRIVTWKPQWLMELCATLYPRITVRVNTGKPNNDRVIIQDPLNAAALVGKDVVCPPRLRSRLLALVVNEEQRNERERVRVVVQADALPPEEHERGEDRAEQTAEGRQPFPHREDPPGLAQLLRVVQEEVHEVTDADPLGNEPLFDGGGRIVGRATAGGYGHVLGKSMAIGYVEPEYAAVGTSLVIEVLGERKRATVLVDSPFDPENLHLKA